MRDPLIDIPVLLMMIPAMSVLLFGAFLWALWSGEWGDNESEGK